MTQCLWLGECWPSAPPAHVPTDIQGIILTVASQLWIYRRPNVMPSALEMVEDLLGWVWILQVSTCTPCCFFAPSASQRVVSSAFPPSLHPPDQFSTLFCTQKHPASPPPPLLLLLPPCQQMRTLSLIPHVLTCTIILQSSIYTYSELSTLSPPSMTSPKCATSFDGLHRTNMPELARYFPILGVSLGIRSSLTYFSGFLEMPLVGVRTDCMFVFHLHIPI